MEWIDTHTHLYLRDFEKDISEVIQRAKNKAVNYFLLPHIDSETTDLFLNLIRKFPTECLPMTGLHPCSVKNDYEIELKKCENFLKKSDNKMYGIGEIGLDYYWDKNYYPGTKKSLTHTTQLGKRNEITFFSSQPRCG